MKKFKTVSSLHAHLVDTITKAITEKIFNICANVVRKNIEDKVYKAYVPHGDFPYQRTFELLNSVSVGNLKIRNKSVSFDVYMDTSKIHPYPQKIGGRGWNAHADVYFNDVSDFIPLWIEEGTEGSLWDRSGAHYMESSKYEIEDILPLELVKSLKSKGWKVVTL